MDIFYNINFHLSSIFSRPHISAHICDFARAVTLGHVRQVRSARELSSKSQLCTNLCGRKTFYFMLAPFVFSQFSTRLSRSVWKRQTLHHSTRSQAFYFMVAPLQILYAQDSEQPLEIRKITPLSALARK